MSRPRLHDDGFLAFLRQKPCCICGSREVQAAHIRIGFFGLGKKPDDRYATPLCSGHHREQHSENETAFWSRYGRNPWDIAQRLYREYGGNGGKPRRKRTTIKPRLPKEERAKIQSRPFQKRRKTWG